MGKKLLIMCLGIMVLYIIKIAQMSIVTANGNKNNLQ